MKIARLNSDNAKLRNAIFLAIGLVILFISRNFGMFWDNILFTTISGDYLYNNGVFNWDFPLNIDTGHPPLLGTLLAIAWKILGQKLWVTHLVILPFTVGILYQLHRFSFYFLKNYTWALLSTLLVIADPTLSVQFFNVNPEVVFIFFFLLTINAILYQQRFLKIIGLALLSIISLRSMMLAAGVFIFDLLNQRWIEQKKFKIIFNKEFITSYIFGSIPGVVFVLWRLLTKGYIQTHPGSPWEGFWHLASWDVFLRNVMILIHRFLDFGRIFIVLFLLLSIILLKRKFFSKNVKQVIILGISSVTLVAVINSLSTNTMGHRYFITGYMMLTFAAVLILQKFKKHKRLVYAILLIGLLSGNLWVYPRKIAQGWDASLAHIPFHKLRIDAIKYLDSQSIDTKDVGAFGIYTLPFHYIDLSKDWRHFESYDSNNKYLFYSNINNLKDEEYTYIDHNYSIIKEFKQYPVHIYIYKRNHYATD